MPLWPRNVAECLYGSVSLSVSVSLLNSRPNWPWVTLNGVIWPLFCVILLKSVAFVANYVKLAIFSNTQYLPTKTQKMLIICQIDWREVGLAFEMQCFRNCTLSSWRIKKQQKSMQKTHFTTQCGRHKSRLLNNKNHCVWPHDVQKSRCALTRRAAVLIICIICAHLELIFPFMQVLKLGWFSVGWLILVARPLVVGTSGHHGVKHSDFCCFIEAWLMSPLHCIVGLN